MPTEMRELGITSRVSPPLPQAPAQELDTLRSQLSDALALRQQELDASRSRELELATVRAQLAEALQTAQSALHASQAQLQRTVDELEAMRHAGDGTMTQLQQELNIARVQLGDVAQAVRARDQEVAELRSQLGDTGRNTSRR